MAKVLVVEDDTDSRAAMVTALTRAGHTVAGTADGRDGLAAVVRDAAELIVLDIRMPAMDGRTFMQVLRSYRRWRDIPVVVVTGVSDDHEIERVSELGVERVFRKANFHLKDLVACVDQILPGQNRSDC